MSTPVKAVQATSVLSGGSLLFWRVLQGVLFAFGIILIALLVFWPQIGINLFWNGLIPLAPALFVLATGVWRNICPLAGWSLLPRHLGIGEKKRLKVKAQQQFQVIGMLLLLVLVPMRHLLFDTSGPATAVLLLSIALLAIILGYLYDWKSGWCAGMCPIQPIEELYGKKVAVSPANAHCVLCKNCVIPCPDSSNKLDQKKGRVKFKWLSNCRRLLIGGFPGFVWGWFQVPDYQGWAGWDAVFIVYALPISGLVITYLLYEGLDRWKREETKLRKDDVFAAAAVIIYYWFRIPALFGWGIYPGDGMLFDLSEKAPEWTPMLFQLSVVLLFSWWMLVRSPKAATWLVRPPFKKRISS